jgi:hypothetical protein
MTQKGDKISARENYGKQGEDKNWWAEKREKEDY